MLLASRAGKMKLESPTWIILRVPQEIETDLPRLAQCYQQISLTNIISIFKFNFIKQSVYYILYTSGKFFIDHACPVKMAG